MRAEHLLISLVGLLLGFFLIFCGVILFLVPFVPHLAQVAQAITLHHLNGLSYFGLTLLFLGLFFLTLLVWLNRRRYLLFKMGGVSIEDRLIAHFARETLQKLFPGQRIECDVVVKRKKRIEILANIPILGDGEEERLRDVEKVLAAILKKQCQYDREFILNVSYIE